MKRKLVHIVVFCVVLLTICLVCTSFCFATTLDDYRKQLENPIYENAVIKTLEVNANDSGTRATHTIDDIYNLLWYFFDSPSNLGPSFETYFQYNGVNLATINSIIYSSLDGFYDTYFTQGLPIYADIANNTADISSKVQTTNAKLEYVFSAIEDTINLKWYSTTLGYAGYSHTLNGSFLNTNSSGNDFYFAFNFDSAITDTVPSCYRLFVPCVMQLGEFIKPDFTLDLHLKVNNVMANTQYNGDYFVENTKNGFYIYLFDFRFPVSGQYWFGIHSEQNLNAYNTYEGYIVSIPFDTVDYQLIRTAFNTNEMSVQNDALDRLAALYASNDYIAAKAAQQDYEDDVITNFTGSGEAAASRGDQASLKDTSKTFKTGLQSGGSVNNSLGVLDNNNSIWQWFSTEVKDSLDTIQSNPASINFYYNGSFSTTSTTYNLNINTVPLNKLVYIEINCSATSSIVTNIFWRGGGATRNFIGSINNQSYVLFYSAPTIYYGTQIRFENLIPNATYSIKIYDIIYRYSSDPIINFYNPNQDFINEELNNGKSNSERR